MTFSARSAAEAYDLVLDKAVYAALQVRVLNEDAQEINLDQLSAMAKAK